MAVLWLALVPTATTSYTLKAYCGFWYDWTVNNTNRNILQHKWVAPFRIQLYASSFLCCCFLLESMSRRVVVFTTLFEAQEQKIMPIVSIYDDLCTFRFRSTSEWLSKNFFARFEFIEGKKWARQVQGIDWRFVRKNGICQKMQILTHSEWNSIYFTGFPW